MKTKFYTQLFTFIAIIGVFVVILPINVLATDSSFITNVVFSTNSTGGQSSNGADGADGQAGKDGENGADGQAGKDGQSINSTRSDVTLQIKSTIDGVDTETVAKSEAFLDNTDTATATHATSSSSSVLEINDGFSNQNSTAVAADELSFISRTLLSLRLMLINYVNKLF